MDAFKEFLYSAGQLFKRAIAWPFRKLYQLFLRLGWIWRSVIATVLALGIFLYGYFLVQTQMWTNFDPDYPTRYNFNAQNVNTGQAEAQNAQTGDAAINTCAPSAVVNVTADLIDFNVNQNSWISSMLLYRLGFFGMEWDDTPFMDNKASFQRGVNQAIRRVTVELVDTLGRVRGTSQIDSNLQSARGNMQYDEYSWYFGLSPFGFKTPTPSFHRQAIQDLRVFNTRLEQCLVVFDARSDNLVQLFDRIASDIGSTSDILSSQIQSNNRGPFDTRADDRFWFAYGQMYGYYGILRAARADFDVVVRQRDLDRIWTAMDQQLRAGLNLQPWIVSNGPEDGWFMPSHLANIGFHLLRFRSNLVEMRSVLDR